MAAKPDRLLLTTSQAACLTALRDGKDSMTGIAIHAKLDLRRTIVALHKLEELGLVRRGAERTWLMTMRGKRGHFRTLREESRQPAMGLGPGMQRVLDALNRPMRGRDLAIKLHMTVPNIHYHIVTLYSQGQLRLGDPDRILLIVSRTDDKTPLLTFDEDRLLSAIPADSATGLTSIRTVIQLPEPRIRQLLKRLIDLGLVETRDGLDGEVVFGVTAAGLNHPQRSDRRRAKPQRLPLQSDRVLIVLSAIRDAGALRIKDLRDNLSLPDDSIRALVQYLKRKEMVWKTDRDFAAPYSLTDKGMRTLAEMTRRLAA
jgi:DNA-binding IclR family transcriptional regulator